MELIMHEMVVACFESEKAAARGKRELKVLHDEGAASVFASALVVKDNFGLVSVREESGKGPVATLLGLLAGGVLGLLSDGARNSVDLKFLDDVGKAMKPGSAAVLAEIEESWTTLIEPRFIELGGKVFRQFRTDFLDQQLLKEAAAVQTALGSLNEELDKASAGDAAIINKGIAGRKEQLKEIQSRAKAFLELKKAEVNAKTQVLQSQAKTASQKTRAILEKRIVDSQAEFDRRSKKLNEALSLAKEL